MKRFARKIFVLKIFLVLGNYENFRVKNNICVFKKNWARLFLVLGKYET